MLIIRPITVDDLISITNIYNHYVLHSIATFEEYPISLEQMTENVDEVINSGYPWLVAVEDDKILGYAYGCQLYARSGFRYTAESSIYLSPTHCQQGVGKILYGELLEELKNKGLHSVIAGISIPHEGSIKLHQYFGFEQVAYFKEVGFKFNRFIDLSNWQKNLS